MEPDLRFNELAQYFQSSPNALVAGCLNTHESIDGVVFPGIEPMEDAFCFVGRPSILAAVGVLFGITPDEVASRLADDKQVKKTEVTALQKKNRELQTKIDLIHKNLSDLLDD